MKKVAHVDCVPKPAQEKIVKRHMVRISRGAYASPTVDLTDQNRPIARLEPLCALRIALDKGIGE